MVDSRKIVGYVRSFSGEEACDVQMALIKNYCQENNVICTTFYRDVGFRKTRTIRDKETSEQIGINSRQWIHVFPAWKQMMLDVISEEIGCILVDTSLRLYDGVDQKQALDRLCKQHNVEIVEVGQTNSPDAAVCKKVAIYHYTVCPERRTSVVLKDIDQLYGVASHQSGWEITALYLDLNNSRRQQLETLLTDCKADIVFVKSFSHIKRAMIPFLTALRMLYEDGVELVSMTEGKIVFMDEEYKEWREKPFRVAAYDRPRSKRDIIFRNIQVEKFKIFVDCKAIGWIIKDIYIDEQDEKKKLDELERNASQYDIILVDTFGKFGEKVVDLIRIMQRTEIPIYSFKERGLRLYGPENI